MLNQPRRLLIGRVQPGAMAHGLCQQALPLIPVGSAQVQFGYSAEVGCAASDGATDRGTGDDSDTSCVPRPEGPRTNWPAPGTQYALAVLPGGDRITERSSESLEDGGLQKEGLDGFRLLADTSFSLR